VVHERREHEQQPNNPGTVRFESDIQRSRDSPYSKAGMISNDEFRQVRHMQSDAITFSNPLFDQSAGEAIDLRG
jgi:hypothetical protein